MTDDVEMSEMRARDDRGVVGGRYPLGDLPRVHVS
jgi:hypothetical protein